MWSWFKSLWASKGGGCIATGAASISATLTPPGADLKTSSRSCNDLQDVARQLDGGERPVGKQQLAELQQQAAEGGSTPLAQQLAVHFDSRELGDQQTCTAEKQMENGHINLPSSAGRYMYSDGKPVGFANTVTRYQESRPLKPNVTPFEARLEAKIAEEEVAAAALATAATAGGPRPAIAEDPQKQLFNMGIAQEQ